MKRVAVVTGSNKGIGIISFNYIESLGINKLILSRLRDCTIFMQKI